MKTTSKVTRYVALGLSIAHLAMVAISCISILCALLLYLIPIIGWIALLYTIIVFPLGLLILWSIAGTIFSLIASIKAVKSLAKNKHKVSTGVLVAIAALFAGIPACIVPIAAGSLTIVSAVFKKKVEQKEAAEEATEEVTTEAE